MTENDETEIVRQFKNKISYEKERRIEKYQIKINSYFDTEKKANLTELDEYLLCDQVDDGKESESHSKILNSSMVLQS